MINFSDILRIGQELASMPPITIKSRTTDLFVVYDKKLTRFDRIAKKVYLDETYRRILEFANPEYFCEFDIPDQTIIRVPFPLQEVLREVIAKVTDGKFKDNLQ